MKATRKKHAFTLIEVMIVVVIVSLLIAIGVPNLIRAREQARAKSCSRNLHYLEGVKEQWALDKRKNAGDLPVWSDLVGPALYLKATPTCPSGATMTPNAVGTIASCTGTVGYSHTYNGQP